MKLFGSDFREDIDKMSSILSGASKESTKDASKRPEESKPIKTNDVLTKSESVKADDAPVKSESVKVDTADNGTKTSLQSVLEAYDYAGTDQLNADVKSAMQGEPLSDNLRKTLEVLVDNKRFREFLLTQCEVKEKAAKPKAPSYNLYRKFIDANGDDVPDGIVEVIEDSGADFKKYNIRIEVRKELNGKDLGKATAEEAAKFLKDIEAGKGTPKGDDKGTQKPKSKAPNKGAK